MPPEVCNEADDNCDGQIDEGFKNELGQYSLVSNCGNCENNCDSIPYPNASPVCDTSSGSAPFCSYSCVSGYFDVDLNPTNGCECELTNSEDLPADGKDPNYVKAYGGMMETVIKNQAANVDEQQRRNKRGGKQRRKGRYVVKPETLLAKARTAEMSAPDTFASRGRA